MLCSNIVYLLEQKTNSKHTMHLYTYLKIHHKAKKPYIVIQSCSRQFFKTCCLSFNSSKKLICIN